MKVNEGNDKYYIFVQGCSGSGKTTASGQIVEEFEESGIGAKIIGCDPFYDTRKVDSMLEKEQVNFEQIKLIRLDTLGYLINKLQTGASINLPTYQYTDKDKNKITAPGSNDNLSPNTQVIILEGIFAEGAMKYLLKRGIIFSHQILHLIYIKKDLSQSLKHRIKRRGQIGGKEAEQNEENFLKSGYQEVLKTSAIKMQKDLENAQQFDPKFQEVEIIQNNGSEEEFSSQIKQISNQLIQKYEVRIRPRNHLSEKKIQKLKEEEKFPIPPQSTYQSSYCKQSSNQKDNQQKKKALLLNFSQNSVGLKKGSVFQRKK